MIAAYVDSYTSPGIVYTIRREGTPIALGGGGTRWHCDCPAFARMARSRGVYAPSCKHLRDVWQALGSAARE